MNPLVEKVAEALHKEYRATARYNNVIGYCAHAHEWKSCEFKGHMRGRAKRFIESLGLLEKEEATNRWLQARALLQRLILGYCKSHRERDMAIAGLLVELKEAKQMVEAATAAGISFNWNPETCRMDARNKLAEKRPTRVIKLPNESFYTMKITKLDSGYCGRCGNSKPECKCPKPISCCVPTVSDATGDSGDVLES